MSTASTNTLDQYNKTVLRSNHRRALWRKLIRVLFPTVVMVAVACVGLVYLSNLPRERFARSFGLLDRVWLGVTTSVRGAWLSSQAQSEVGKDSPLPRAELYIKGKRLDALTANVPESGRKAQEAKFHIDGEEYDVTARLRGDSMNHWAYPQKSWRISLKGNDIYEGMRELNLNVPRSDSQIANWLGYEMAKRAGMPLVPNAINMQFRLNREFDGVRLLLEQPNEDFIAARGLPQGKIYVGDITTEQIYGSKARPHLYTEADPWEVRTSLADTSKREMSELLRIVREVHDPYLFLKQIGEVLDLKAMAQYIALLDLVGSVHIDETHNGKFYFNPSTGKLVPIVWDTVAYFWGDRHELDQASSNLFRVLLSNPGFRDLKDQELWRMVSGELSKGKLHRIIDQEIARIAPDTEAFALKLRANDKGVKHLSNQDWFNGVAATKEAVAARDARVRQWLSKSDTQFTLTPKGTTADGRRRYELGVRAASPAGIELTALNLVTKQLDGGSASDSSIPRAGSPREFVIERRGVADMLGAYGEGLEQAVTGLGTTIVQHTDTLASSSSSTRVVLNDKLLSKRRFVDRKVPEVVPSVYVYTITVPAGLELAKVDFFARNAITKRAVPVKFDPSVEVPEAHKQNSLWWTPSAFLPKVNRVLRGQVVIDRDLVLPRGAKLTIEPGSSLLMHAGASIIVTGGDLVAEGTAERPIIIKHVVSREAKSSLESSAETWGVIGLKSAKGSFKHFHLYGGSTDTVGLTIYPSALSFYNSDVVFEDGLVNGAFISADSSSISLKRVAYSNSINDLIKSVRSKVLSDGVSSNAYTPKLPLEFAGESVATAEGASLSFEMPDYSLGKGEAKKVAEGLAEYLSDSCRKGSLSLKLASLCAPLAQSGEGVKLPIEERFVFEVYYDSEAALGLRSKTSLSARYQFASKDAFEANLKQPLWSKNWPVGFSYRSQFGWEQEEASGSKEATLARVTEVSDDFGMVDTASFDQKTPLSAYAPWSEEEFLSYPLSGYWRGRPIGAAMTFADRVKLFAGSELVNDATLELSPKIAETTREFLLPMSATLPSGKRANVLRVKIGRVKLYDAQSFLHYVSERKLGEKIDEPNEGQDLSLVEFEIAPGLLTMLAKEIDQESRSQNGAANVARVRDLEAFRRSLMQDVAMIVKQVQQYLVSQQIELKPVKKGRYEWLHDGLS